MNALFWHFRFSYNFRFFWPKISYFVTVSGNVSFRAILSGTPTSSTSKFGSGEITVRAEKLTRFPSKFPRNRPCLPFNRCVKPRNGSTNDQKSILEYIQIFQILIFGPIRMHQKSILYFWASHLSGIQVNHRCISSKLGIPKMSHSFLNSINKYKSKQHNH